MLFKEVFKNIKQNKKIFKNHLIIFFLATVLSFVLVSIMIIPIILETRDYLLSGASFRQSLFVLENLKFPLFYFILAIFLNSLVSIIIGIFGFGIFSGSLWFLVAFLFLVKAFVVYTFGYLNIKYNKNGKVFYIMHFIDVLIGFFVFLYLFIRISNGA